MFESKKVIQKHTDLGIMFLVNVKDNCNVYSNKLCKAVELDNMLDQEIDELLKKAQINELKYSSDKLEIETYEYLNY